ncbi:MAG: hypothetical protein ACLP8A_14705 [Methylovirgula sp.]
MLLRKRALYQVDSPLTHIVLQPQMAIAGPAQIIRAVIVGLIFALIFLWALPQHRLLYADNALAAAAITS